MATFLEKFLSSRQQEMACHSVSLSTKHGYRTGYNFPFSTREEAELYHETKKRGEAWLVFSQEELTELMQYEKQNGQVHPQLLVKIMYQLPEDAAPKEAAKEAAKEAKETTPPPPPTYNKRTTPSVTWQLCEAEKHKDCQCCMRELCHVCCLYIPECKCLWLGVYAPHPLS